MKINVKKSHKTITHEGAETIALGLNEKLLRRSVFACMLWENQFYEDGQSIAQRIINTAYKCDVETVCRVAIEARQKYHIRHAPLLLATTLLDRGGLSSLLPQIINRPDEITEFVAMCWKPGDPPLGPQVKRGLKRAFQKFDAYQLAKWNTKGHIKLKNVMFFCHPKPKDDAQALAFKQLADGTSKRFNTWEDRIWKADDRKIAWEDLIIEGLMGYHALLQNLKNMDEDGVSHELINQAIYERHGAQNVFPFRFIAAARMAPMFDEALNAAFLKTMAEKPKLPGKTLIVIDISGSMYNASVSQRSILTRLDAACALGAIARECCEDPIIYATAGNDRERIHATARVPNRHGFALIDAIPKMKSKLGEGGIFLNQVTRFLQERHPDVDYIIVITDEQDCGIKEDSPLKAPAYGKLGNYMINVGSYDRSIAHGKWKSMTGFSEAVFDWIVTDGSISTD